MTDNPLDPELLKWLATLSPRNELAMRYALRTIYSAAREDQAFTERTNALHDKLAPTPDEFAAILVDARRLREEIDVKRTAPASAPVAKIVRIKPKPKVERRRAIS